MSLQLSYFKNVIFKLYQIHKLFLTHTSIRIYLLIPGIISIVYMLLVMMAFFMGFDSMAGWVSENVTEWMANWMRLGWSGYVVYPVIRIGSYLFCCIMWWILTTASFKFIILSLTRLWIKPLCNKINSIVFNGIELSTTKQSLTLFSLEKWITSLKISLKHMLEELILTTLIWMISLVFPGFGILTIFIYSYYAGLQLIWPMIYKKGDDYYDAIEYSRNHWCLLMAMGILFYSLLVVPLLGWFIAIPYSTLCGSLALIEIQQKESKIN